MRPKVFTFLEAPFPGGASSIQDISETMETPDGRSPHRSIVFSTSMRLVQVLRRKLPTEIYSVLLAEIVERYASTQVKATIRDSRRRVRFFAEVADRDHLWLCSGPHDN
jgi:hypothetical protein